MLVALDAKNLTGYCADLSTPSPSLILDSYVGGEASSIQLSKFSFLNQGDAKGYAESVLSRSSPSF